jgi:ABC-type Fe3+/spermidine/putrescine transport system ATPase subunit
VRSPFGVVQCPAANFAAGLKVVLGIRPEWIELRNPGEDGPDCFEATIDSRSFLGEAALHWVRVGGARLLVKMVLDLPADGRTTVVLPPERWVIFPEPVDQRATVANEEQVV